MSKVNALIIRFIFSAILLLACAAARAENAGVVVATTGDSYALSAAKQKRPLKRGAAIFTGDTLMTGGDAKLLIRMADNTAVAIHENSEYKVDQYHYDPSNSASNINHASFVKGSMRVLTGAISKDHPEKYELRTPVAVIGVRGTEFSVSFHCVGGGGGDNCRLVVLDRHGLVVVTNNGGSTTLTPGRYTEVHNHNQAPRSMVAPSKNLCF